MNVTDDASERGLFCNRTLNMRGIKAIGYDMDYTLVHYHIEAWERRAYDQVKSSLVALGLPVGDLQFDPDLVVRGLIIDTELGNVVKANRFGYVKRAFHGTRPLAFEALRETYSRTIVDLSERRWVFLNTLFSLSEACLYMQLVDLFDAGEIKDVRGYALLYRLAREQVDHAHMEGSMKAAIAADPERFVDLDPDAALALLDQKHAQKRLLLITNSEWSFTRAMMSYAYDRYLPKSTSFLDLFEIVIVAAQKPSFFSSRPLLFTIEGDGDLLRPADRLAPGRVHFGGNASHVESYLRIRGDEMLYVGDHIFGDVNVSKQILRWRTALVVREIEDEILAARAASADSGALASGMARKELIERANTGVRVKLLRLRAGYGPTPLETEDELQHQLAHHRQELEVLDAEVAPLARAASEVGNKNWGPIMWAGNDKSHYARQVERYADIYTSRVSNFTFATPYVYLRSPRGTLPHDRAPNPLPAAETSGHSTSGRPTYSGS